MKKALSLAFIFVLVLGLFFTGNSKTTSATQQIITPTPVSPGIAPGDWEWTSADVVGEEVAMEDILTKPASWLQLITKGLEVKAPATICHPFRGAQFGWSGSIYKVEGETWVKQVSTTQWVPTSEGRLMTCAQVSSAGTYALFGFYVKPDVVEEIILPEPA
jgi:hypothetical protein